MKKPLFLALLALPIVTMAQTQLVIKLMPTTGSESSYALSSVTKHYYSNGKLITSFNDAPDVETILSTLSKVVFGIESNIPTKLEAAQQAGTDYALYPMPVNEALHLSFESSVSSSVTVEILTLEGRTVLSQQRSTVQGNNKLTLSVSELNSGLYLCRITNETEIYTQQIIKQ